MADLLSISKDIMYQIKVDFNKISVIQMNRSTASDKLFALLVFLDDQSDPFAFIKGSLNPEREKQLENEFNNLSLLQDCGSDKFKQTIPEPLYFGNLNGYFILVEKAKSGKRMKDFPPDKYFTSKHFLRHFNKINTWLYEFHRCLTDKETPRLPHNLENLLTIPINNYRRNFQVSTKLDSMLDETLKRLEYADIPLSPWHGDFCTANILITGDDQINVVDWEFPIIKTWPLADLLYFFSSIWCIPFKSDKRWLKNNYRHLFFERHHHTNMIKDAVLLYMQSLSINREFILPLSVISWVHYANRKHEELLHATVAASGIRAEDWAPLTMVEDNYCVNLEFLAENRDKYF